MFYSGICDYTRELRNRETGDEDILSSVPSESSLLEDRVRQ